MTYLKKLSLVALLSATCGFANGQANADSLINFIAANKSRSAFYFVKNDTVMAAVNGNKVMPLASTMKILVAVEFAKQAGSGVIDEDSYVALSELDKYYIANTDGNAHPSWLTFERGRQHIREDSVKLIDVARGMILFSSNANTEYLMDLLGLDNIKNNIQLFGLQDHTAIFPLVASLFLYQNPRQVKEEKILKGIRSLNEEQYCKTILQVHNALKYDTVLKHKFRPQDLSMRMQKLWSDRLPAASVKSYVQLCSILNKRKYLDENSYGILAQVLEYILENPANRKFYKRFGLKGGSTAFVLTEAFYATTQNGVSIEAACFFNDLTDAENTKLQGWLNDLRIGLTQNEAFRQKVARLFR